MSKPLYAVAIFLSAFLLLFVQPMMGRTLLPFFGGSVSVWGAGLAFFTSTLFFGYLYVYGISRLPFARQVRIHGVFLGVAAAFVLAALAAGAVVRPSFDWAFGATGVPSVRVLLALAGTIGIPYLLLASTGPLLQHWYAHEVKKEPYHLYALSNLGSLLALGAYPFLVEPAFGLGAQRVAWSVLFLCCAGLLGLVARAFWRVMRAEAPAPAAADSPGVAPAEPIAWVRRLAWLVLAALPAAMLVATTARLTQAITPVPFMWVLPLALYLLSFVLAFRGRGKGALLPLLVLVCAVASFLLPAGDFRDIPAQFAANLGLLFFGAWWCHAVLYRRRPGATSSPVFYLWLSLGGAVGTVLTSVGAPLIFPDPFEFFVVAAALVVVAIVGFPLMTYLRDEYLPHALTAKILLVALVLAGVWHERAVTAPTGVYVDRNFYGTVRIVERDGMRQLYHGTTMHGGQFLDEERAGWPTAYYVAESGAARAISQARAEADGPARVGILGLGMGGLAAYCEPEDTFAFYEIDPDMEGVARRYFGFMDACEGADVRLGDGRLVLERELQEGGSAGYDVMVMDAFNDDAVPVHVLTKEALALYRAHLRGPRSFIAVHTSNRYLAIAPVVLRAAEELGLAARVVENRVLPGSETGGVPSQYVVLAEDPAAFDTPAFADLPATAVTAARKAWTDDYANVLSAVRMR